MNCFYQFKSKFISGIIRLLLSMKVFSNLRFLNIDIDVVNNNESNQKLLRASCSVLSPPGEGLFISFSSFRSCWDVL